MRSRVSSLERRRIRVAEATGSRGGSPPTWRTSAGSRRLSTPLEGEPTVRGSTRRSGLPTRTAAERPLQDELSLVLDAIESGEAFHTDCVEKIERALPRLPGDRGEAASGQSVPGWRSEPDDAVHPPGGRGDARHDARPEADVGGDAEPASPASRWRRSSHASSRRGSPASALQWAMDEDDFALKQRPFMQQDLIAGMTVAKVVWAYEARDMTRSSPIEIEVADDFGAVRDRYTSTEERGATVVMRDGPSMIVRDVRDFFWPEGAKGVDDAAWVIDRSWQTYDDLMAKEDAGFYAQLRGAEGGAQRAGSTTTDSEREQMLSGAASATRI